MTSSRVQTEKVMKLITLAYPLPLIELRDDLVCTQSSGCSMTFWHAGASMLLEQNIASQSTYGLIIVHFDQTLDTYKILFVTI